MQPPRAGRRCQDSLRSCRDQPILLLLVEGTRQKSPRRTSTHPGTNPPRSHRPTRRSRRDIPSPGHQDRPTAAADRDRRGRHHAPHPAQERPDHAPLRPNLRAVDPQCHHRREPLMAATPALVPPLSSYVAKRCPLRIQLNLVEPGVPLEPTADCDVHLLRTTRQRHPFRQSSSPKCAFRHEMRHQGTPLVRGNVSEPYPANPLRGPRKVLRRVPSALRCPHPETSQKRPTQRMRGPFSRLTDSWVPPETLVVALSGPRRS